MADLNPEKLHLKFKDSVGKVKLELPRKYTLTHSDSTGELFLTIGAEYDYEQISSLYTRFMRDEVLAEWKKSNNYYE
ncbi:MAG: staygreen family protein, partial [Promethearchaeota archaeon]